MIRNNLAMAAKQDLFDNPCQRLPVCLCLDISGSMGQNTGKVEQLNQGVELFYKSVQEDEITANSAEIAVVTFGGMPPVAKCVRDFSRVDIQKAPPALKADGYTPLGEGVTLALDLLEKRKESYKKAGISYFRPWLIIMSDGRPEGHSPAVLENAQKRVAELTAKKGVVALPIAIGSYNGQDLAKFGGGSVLHLKEDSFSNFFKWLHKSVSTSSSSTPGDELDFNKLLAEAVTWSSDL